MIGSKYDGIYANNVTDITITNSRVLNCNDGIEVYNSKDRVIVENNVLTGNNHYGMYLSGDAELFCENNTVIGSEYGVYLNGLNGYDVEITNVSADIPIDFSNVNFENILIQNVTSISGSRDSININGNIENLTIENANLNLNKHGVGILLDGYLKDVIIKDAIIRDPYWAGIQLKRSINAYYYKNVTIDITITC